MPMYQLKNEHEIEDALGRKLNVGDRVAFTFKTYGHLYRGTILAFHKYNKSAYISLFNPGTHNGAGGRPDYIDACRILQINGLEEKFRDMDPAEVVHVTDNGFG